ncbi:MAG TPA: L,D-transpeptidase family protein [Alphaproteobacteria bacterium]|jgi:L,D-peptidoglycan transpeptidase YkuD (ErfK/YbiS/YcfS/YnhG family)|nr:L,D-transpeptidase family protein [Alphaproteobacteria bacterium]HJP22887.1 L,D-transpeptidase family protein [Alphaproteobacteria bacterium]
MILVRGETLECAGQRYRCALGRGGIGTTKREGDGVTPAGAWPLRRLLYRPDRLAVPAGGLTALALRPEDGWCDDADDEAYNCQVSLPYAARCEELWRQDSLYDVIVVLGYNDDPPVPGLGSAIFFHVARPDYGPTEGCVALALNDLLAVLAKCGPDTVITVEAGR